MSNTEERPQQVGNPHGLCKASREKFWSELTDQDKIERMRGELKRTQQQLKEARAELYQYKAVAQLSDAGLKVGPASSSLKWR